ncbi:hypothetical protein [Hyphomicrobium sp. CS1BSMeth3]|uniref:hypothetical protein n=1 Tax=Hyphomicrobium sp. CS1BSMeth3 TaxID=1892844 RepID=UPI0009307C99|nr:hypothetical protein [Hyphomicrobium sp. CS1BSMeth3]
MAIGIVHTVDIPSVAIIIMDAGITAIAGTPDTMAHPICTAVSAFPSLVLAGIGTIITTIIDIRRRPVTARGASAG